MKISHLPRIHNSSYLELNQKITIEKEEFHYLYNVLRLKVRSEFRIFNQTEGEFIVEIVDITKKSLTVLVRKLLSNPVRLKKLTLAMSIIKPDKFILALKGSVELGVSSIIPVITDRTQSRKLNLEKIESAIRSSIEQSERFEMPLLKEPVILEELLSNEEYKQFIIAQESEKSNSILDIKYFSYDPVILIGPEGGFSDKDVKIFESYAKKIDSISLGETVLRAENAAIATIACVNMTRTSVER